MNLIILAIGLCALLMLIYYIVLLMRGITMIEMLMQYLPYLLVLLVLAVPLGGYISRVMDGKHVFLSRLLKPCEKLIYKLLRIDDTQTMDWKQYLISVILFSLFGFVLLFLLLMLQGVLLGNPEGFTGLSWDLSFNTAVSFVTNTNWQAYSGESQLSYLSQALG